MFDRHDNNKFTQNLIATKNINSRIIPIEQIRNG